jgi:hypothetical protein
VARSVPSRRRSYARGAAEILPKPPPKRDNE